jgi:hypothetical protein
LWHREGCILNINFVERESVDHRKLKRNFNGRRYRQQQVNA